MPVAGVEGIDEAGIPAPLACEHHAANGQVVASFRYENCREHSRHSGKFYALVEGNVDDVAAVLKVPYFLRPEGTVPEGFPFDLKASVSRDSVRFSERPATWIA